MEKGRICKERIFLFGFFGGYYKEQYKILKLQSKPQKIKKRLFNITVWLENLVKLCLSCGDKHFGHELGGITGNATLIRSLMLLVIR